MPHNRMQYNLESKDMDLFFMVGQIVRDYEEFIKNAVMPEITAKHEIKIRELLVLICIQSALQPVTSADIATVMRKDPATMTRSTLVLIGKKYITTMRSRTDNRGKILQMTDQGQAVILDYKNLMKKAEAVTNRRQSSDGRFVDDGALGQILQSIAQRAKTMANVSAERGFAESLNSNSDGAEGAAETCSAIIY
ncbi:MAG: MarR family winged helix-turn-helix transcriptional regulator [Alphaproteobacteria bacterium]